jgi:hypothetical protein
MIRTISIRVALLFVILVLVQGVFASVALAQAGSGRLENPLNPAFSSIPGFIEGVLRAIIIVALPIVTLFIVISGFMFVSARGNEGKLTKAKENFKYVIIGAILILGAWVLATLIAGTVTQLTGR